MDSGPFSNQWPMEQNTGLVSSSALQFWTINPLLPFETCHARHYLSFLPHLATGAWRDAYRKIKDNPLPPFRIES